jgi:hypothetical protein
MYTVCKSYVKLFDCMYVCMFMYICGYIGGTLQGRVHRSRKVS